MLKHYPKLKKLSINPKTEKVDMRKLKSKAFLDEFMKVIVKTPILDADIRLINTALKYGKRRN